MIFENFVGIMDNVFSPEYCETLIKRFEQVKEQGFTYNRLESDDNPTLRKDDDSLLPSDSTNMDIFVDHQREFSEKFWGVVYKEYSQKYSVLDTFAAHTIFFNKIQKTSVGGGYHIWHTEAMTRESANRVLTYIVYLNDVEEGGETELLYLQKRIKPKAGTVIVFPAGFTHTHRGNPPLSGEKYIMTGWVEL